MNSKNCIKLMKISVGQNVDLFHDISDHIYTVLSRVNKTAFLEERLFLARQLPVIQGLLNHEFSISPTTTHHSRYDSSGRVISSSQRPLPDNTQQSQQTGIHAPGGIRTHNLSRRAAADLRLRRRSHWSRLSTKLRSLNMNISLHFS
jgi:hypothetical protein